jgi:hypothetical protein
MCEPSPRGSFVKTLLGWFQLISSALRNDAAKTWRSERLNRDKRRSMTQRKRISDVLRAKTVPGITTQQSGFLTH